MFLPMRGRAIWVRVLNREWRVARGSARAWSSTAVSVLGDSNEELGADPEGKVCHGSKRD